MEKARKITITYGQEIALSYILNTTLKSLRTLDINERPNAKSNKWISQSLVILTEEEVICMEKLLDNMKES